MFGRLFRSRSIFSFEGLFFSSKLFRASSSKKRLAKEKSTIVPHKHDWIHPELPAPSHPSWGRKFIAPDKTDFFGWLLATCSLTFSCIIFVTHIVGSPTRPSQ